MRTNASEEHIASIFGIKVRLRYTSSAIGIVLQAGPGLKCRPGTNLSSPTLLRFTLVTPAKCRYVLQIGHDSSLINCNSFMSYPTIMSYWQCP